MRSSESRLCDRIPLQAGILGETLVGRLEQIGTGRYASAAESKISAGNRDKTPSLRWEGCAVRSVRIDATSTICEWRRSHFRAGWLPARLMSVAIVVENAFTPCNGRTPRLSPLRHSAGKQVTRSRGLLQLTPSTRPARASNHWPRSRSNPSIRLSPTTWGKAVRFKRQSRPRFLATTEPTLISRHQQPGNFCRDHRNPRL